VSLYKITLRRKPANCHILLPFLAQTVGTVLDILWVKKEVSIYRHPRINASVEWSVVLQRELTVPGTFGKQQNHNHSPIVRFFFKGIVMLWSKRTMSRANVRTKSTKCTCPQLLDEVFCVTANPPARKWLPHLSKAVVRPRDQPLPSSCLPAYWVGSGLGATTQERLGRSSYCCFRNVYNRPQRVRDVWLENQGGFLRFEWSGS